MDIWEVLLDVVILLGAGALLGALAERLRQSAIVGYLVAGALLGPNALHAIDSSEEVLALSELGVALLLFAIGLEFSWSRLRAMGRIALGGGVVQVTVTLGVGATIAAGTGLSLATAIAMGAILALSSTACVLRVLTSRAEVESIHGERALGILLVQDMAVVPLVVLVTVLGEGGPASEILLRAMRTLGIGLAQVVVLYVVFYHLVPRLLRTNALHANRELSLLVAIVSGLGSGVAAHAAGVSPALATFIAGMLLAESPFAIQVRADVGSLKTLLLTLFFTGIGMLSDPGWIADNAGLVAASVVGVIAVKSTLVWAGLRALGATGPAALATGLCVAQVGEFSFVLADISRGTLLDGDLFLLVVSVAVITMLVTPYLVALAPHVAARVARGKGREPHGDVRREKGEAVAIVVGFGPAGRASAERIDEHACHVVVVERNPRAAEDARRLGYDAVTGDATHAEVLEHAGLASASFLVSTVPDAETALRLVRMVRTSAPEVFTLVRGRFHRSLAALEAAGAHHVVDEENEVGRRISEAFAELREQVVVPPASHDPH